MSESNGKPVLLLVGKVGFRGIKFFFKRLINN